MKRIMVRYKVKAEKASENENYIKAVFEQLKDETPAGLRCASFKLEDGVSFVHLASIEAGDGGNPLGELSRFKEFVSDIKDRCVEPPVAVELTELGSYRIFGD